MEAKMARAGAAPTGRAPSYRVFDRESGEEYELAGEQVSRILGIELGYVDWALACDGVFENGRWRVEAGGD